MAVYRDIDADVRIGGSLTLPAGSATIGGNLTLPTGFASIGGSLTVGGVNILTTLNGKALGTTSILAGSGLTGGGDLTTNRTLTISFAGNGVATTVARSDHFHTLDSLNNVTITSNTDGELLVWSTTAGKWINETLAEAGISAAGHTHTFAALTSIPTTLAGYGITDAVSSTGNAASATKLATGRTLTLTGEATGVSAAFDGTSNISFAVALSTTGVGAGIYKSVTVDTKGRVTGGTNPTTLGGYGITDAATSTHNHTLNALSNVTITTPAAGHFLEWNGTAWVNNLLVATDIPNLDWTKITSGRPTTLAGYGITDASLSTHVHTFASLTTKPTTLSGYGITDAVSSTGNAASATKWATGRTITLTGDIGAVSTAFDGTGNLSFATTLANSGVTAGTYKSVTVDVKGRVTAATNPTTLVGYGITDAATSTHNHSLDSLSNVTVTTIDTGHFLKSNGTIWVNDLLVAGDIPNLDWAKITTGKPTTLAGYGITDASLSTHNHAFNSLTSIPTTLAGYGITDASLSTHVHTFSSLTSKPTTLAGYGITDAATSGHNHTLNALSNVTITTIASGNFLKWNGTAWVNNMLAAGDIPSLDWSKITSGKPTTLSGYGITDGAGLVHTHAWADITSGKPTTLAGYGITDASLASHNHDAAYAARGSRPQSVRAIDKRNYTPTDASTPLGQIEFAFTSLNNNSAAPFADAIILSSYTDNTGGGNSMILTTKDGTGVYHRYGEWNGADWLWTKKLAYDQDKVDKTTSLVVGTGLSGGGDLSMNRTIGLNFGTTAGTVAEGNHVHPMADVTGLDTALSNKSDVSHVHTFASLTTKPTTLAGYGITDASLSTHVHTFASLTSKPTTLSGYGITDAATSTHNHNTAYLGITAKATDSDKLNGQLASFYTAGSAFTAHTGDTTIHKSWGNWATSGGGTDLTVSSKRALVHVAATNKLMINYAGDFVGGVEIAGPLTTGGNTVWHSGNLVTSDFVSSSAAATVAGNFTVKGRIWAGDASAAGSIVIKDAANQNAIHLGGTAALSNVKAFISEIGSAKFNSSVQVGSLIVDSNTLVQKLNAEFVGGSKETEFVRTSSIRDNRGYGVHSGLEVVQKSPTPNMTVQIRPGIAYTDSGRRFEWTSDSGVPIAQASANYDRIDIVFIHGKEGGATEGVLFDIAQGLADRVTPIPPVTALPVGAIPLAYVYVKANIGTITDGTSGTFDAIDNSVKKMASVRLAEGISYTINEPVYAGSDIYEKGEKLEDKYAEIAKANTFTGNQDVNGRLKITSSGSLNGVPGSANYYLRVTDGTSTLSIDPDEIVTTGAMNLTAGSTMILSAGAGNSKIDMNGRMKATQNAITLTIPAGQTSVTWTHNYGATTYAVNPVSNSFERHVRWTSKLANTIAIEIDDPSSQDILVDCILIGY